MPPGFVKKRFGIVDAKVREYQRGAVNAFDPFEEAQLTKAVQLDKGPDIQIHPPPSYAESIIALLLYDMVYQVVVNSKGHIKAAPGDDGLGRRHAGIALDDLQLAVPAVELEFNMGHTAQADAFKKASAHGSGRNEWFGFGQTGKTAVFRVTSNDLMGVVEQFFLIFGDIDKKGTLQVVRAGDNFRHDQFQPVFQHCGSLGLQFVTVLCNQVLLSRVVLAKQM